MIYEFAATQDLHGYGKPWAPGAGKNKCDGLAYSAFVNSGISYITSPTPIESPYSITATYNGVGFIVPVEAGVTYALSSDLTGESQNWYCGVYSSFEDMNNRANCLEYASRQSNFTPTNDGFLLFMRYSAGAGTSVTWTYAQAEIGETPTSFAPYANVCMPEGFNIWDPEAQEYTQVYAGYVNANTRELYLRPVYEEYAGEELVGPWMSSLDPYDEDTTPTEGAFVIDFGGELTSLEITPFMLQTLLDSLGIRQHFTNGAGLLNSLMDQAQGRVRSEEELLHLSRPLNVIAIGDQLPSGIKFKPISKDVLPGLPGKFIR